MCACVVQACKKSESPTGEVTYTWSKQAPIPVPRVNSDGEPQTGSDLLHRKTMNAQAGEDKPGTRSISCAGPSPRMHDQLDSMLGSLSADMSKHGIQTVPKGDCHGCGKVIVGQVRAASVHSPTVSRAGDSGIGQNVASGTFCVLSMRRGVGPSQLFRTRWQGLLRERLPQSVLATLCVLQRCY
jgi:hypothetical protein